MDFGDTAVEDRSDERLPIEEPEQLMNE